MKAFAELTEQEILALAISAEEEDARIYADYADGLKADFPASARCSRTWRPRRTSTAAG